MRDESRRILMPSRRRRVFRPPRRSPSAKRRAALFYIKLRRQKREGWKEALGWLEREMWRAQASSRGRKDVDPGEAVFQNVLEEYAAIYPERAEDARRRGEELQPHFKKARARKERKKNDAPYYPGPRDLPIPEYPMEGRFFIEGLTEEEYNAWRAAGIPFLPEDIDE